MASLKETQLRTTLINEFLNSSSLSGIPPATRNSFRQILENSFNEYTPQLINDVETNSNKQLNDIPNNLVGLKNPVDVVSSNLKTTQLNDVLGTAISENVSNDYTGKISNSIFDAFKNQLPTNFSSTIDLNSFKSIIDASTKVAVDKGIDTSIDAFSTQTLSGQFVPPPIVPDIDSFFEQNPSGALEQVSEQFDASISSEALSEARRFNVQSPANTEKLITQTTGFIDPSATFPTKEYEGISEVSKLAQGDVNGTIVQQKEKTRALGIQLPNNESWEQPPTPFKGEYPYNKVMETESGHVIELDDTPGCERIHIYHKSGTFVEIDSNGTVVKKTKGSSYEIIEKNGYISVTGDANLSVKGSIKIFVGGDADIEVEGDTNIKCLNDITMQAAGRVDISATEEINLNSSNINIQADVNLNIKADSSAYLSTKDDMYFKANGTIYHQTLEAYNIKASEEVNVDGSKFYVNSNTSEESTYARGANIGTIGERKDIIKETIPDPVAPNFLDTFGYRAEDSEFETEAISTQKQLRQIGVLSDSDLDQTLAQVDSFSPTSRNSEVISPSDFVLSQTYLPDNFQLSTNFTLAMLSSRAVVTNNPVRAQLGLSYGEIIYNLQGIALNICEPILALYPNMFVTSAFRSTNNSSSTSDHPKGKAVDIQFRNVSKSDYFDIAKKLSTFLNYDKLLLEYKTYGTGLPWIHISFDVNSQRKIALTYLNDKKFGDGLISLA